MTELSQPSSVKVEEIIHQLVQNIVQKFLKDELTSDFMRDSGIVKTGNHQEAAEENCGTVDNSCDYLAKLLFWYDVFPVINALAFYKLVMNFAKAGCIRFFLHPRPC